MRGVRCAPPPTHRGHGPRWDLKARRGLMEASNVAVRAVGGRQGHGPLRGRGGPLRLLDGGGLRVSGGVASVAASSFDGCRAKKGGAIAVLGGSLEVLRR